MTGEIPVSSSSTSSALTIQFPERSDILLRVADVTDAF